MSEKAKHGNNKCLKTKIGQIEIYLFKGFDLAHGKGWFVRSYHDNFKTGFGFHKSNKLTAVRQALLIA